MKYLEGINFYLNQECNWKCWYCHYHTLEKKKEQIQNIYNIEWLYNDIKDKNIWYCITGGEPGLISEEYYSEFFKIFNLKFIIYTNGKFIENQYHTKFKDNINIIFWHYSTEIPENIDIINKEVYYSFVLTPNNYIKALSLTSKYPQLSFDLKIITNKITNEIFSIEQLKEIYTNIQDKNNILDKSKIYILKLIQILDNKFPIKTARRLCYENIKMPTLDLVNNKIYNCCCYENTGQCELTKYNWFNLNKVMKDTFKLYECSFCYKSRQIMDENNLKKYMETINEMI